MQFVDAAATVIRELHASAGSVGGAVALVAGMAWPAGTVRMIMLDADGREVHSQLAKSDDDRPA